MARCALAQTMAGLAIDLACTMCMGLQSCLRVCKHSRAVPHMANISVQGYIYIEAYKESHVKDAVRGLRNIYSSKPPKLVPVKEMVDAITVNRKAKAMIGE